MKYAFYINEQSHKGKAMLEAIKNLGIALEQMPPDRVSPEKLALPGYIVTEEQMESWLDESEKSGDVEFGDIMKVK